MESGDGEAKIKANANNNVEEKMDMDESMADGHLETFPVLILETSADASKARRETEETEGGGEKKKSRVVNIRKRPSRVTTTDIKGQADLKCITENEILTTREGYNVKILHSNMRLYDDSERRIWWIRWRQWFGWKEWTCSKWRDKVDIGGEIEGTMDEGE